MNKELNKAIYARKRLKNSFSKNPIKDNECLYKKQRNKWRHFEKEKYQEMFC